MSLWQQLCIAIAQTFFMGLINSSEKVKAKAKSAALNIYTGIKMAYAGDPDFK